jgi:hypothetical protein
MSKRGYFWIRLMYIGARVGDGIRHWNQPLEKKSSTEGRQVKDSDAFNERATSSSPNCQDERIMVWLPVCIYISGTKQDAASAAMQGQTLPSFYRYIATRSQLRILGIGAVPPVLFLEKEQYESWLHHSWAPVHMGNELSARTVNGRLVTSL